MKCFGYVALLPLGLALVGCAPTATTCPLSLDADLPVTYIDGHLPVITVTLDGHDIKMLVESGAQISSLSTLAYHRLDLTGTAPVRGYSTGIAGTVESNTIILQDLNFGRVRLKQEVLDINDGTIPGKAGKPAVDGVFGYDILASFDIGFDLPDHRIMLFDRQACTGAQTPWPGLYAPAPITLNKETFISTIPFTVDGQDLAAVIDSGSDVTLIAGQALDRLGIKPEMTQAGHGGTLTGIGGHRLQVDREQFGNVQIGAESIDNQWLFVGNSPMSQFNDMILGEDYLARHRVFISNSTNTVYLGLAVAPGG